MWVKVDDGLPDHSKVLAAGRALGTRGAGRVLAIWLQGMCFANRNLTDGFLPESLVRTWTLYDHRPLEVAGAMVDAGLLELAAGGFRFHNYEHYQPDAATIKAKRDRDRQRKKFPRGIQTDSARNPRGVATDSARIPERSRARDPQPLPQPPPQPDPGLDVLRRSEREATPTSVPRRAEVVDTHSRGPIYRGRRIVVFAFHLDNLERMLGPHAEAFELGAWFDTLDRRADAIGLVMPQRDLDAWLQEQTLEEAARRGLRIARASSHPLGVSMFQPGTSDAEMLAALRESVAGDKGKP